MRRAGTADGEHRRLRMEAKAWFSLQGCAAAFRGNMALAKMRGQGGMGAVRRLHRAGTGTGGAAWQVHIPCGCGMLLGSFAHPEDQAPAPPHLTAFKRTAMHERGTEKKANTGLRVESKGVGAG